MNEPAKILLNTGPSERGWHRLENFLRCPMLYYWATRTERGVPAEPLVRGSIGHAGLAHLYCRKRAADLKDAAEYARYYAPSDAMRLVAETFGERGRRLFPTVHKALLGYVRQYGVEPFAVLQVEQQLETAFQGHRYTARADLVVKDYDGRTWIYDHKFVARVEKKALRRYTLSGQFLGLNWLGQAAFGSNFGGVKLNLIGMDGSFERRPVEPAPFMLAQFPTLVATTERRIAALEAESKVAKNQIAVWAANAAPSEQTCYTAYGECPCFESCRWGQKRL